MPSIEREYTIGPADIYDSLQNFFKDQLEFKVVQKMKNRGIFAIGGREHGIDLMFIGIIFGIIFLFIFLPISVIVFSSALLATLHLPGQVSMQTYILNPIR